MRKFSRGRRNFFKQSACGVVGAGLITQDDNGTGRTESQASPRIKEYRTLGRTGFKVSDLCCGSITDEGVLRAALDAGMNYIDTAEQYPGHHGIVAKAMQGRDRKSVFITTKLEIQEDKSKEGILKRARKALEELQMDHVDCLMMHCPEKVETLATEGFHAAMTELKTEGRVRFVGVSHHGSFWFRDSKDSMEKILLAAADDGRFDVVLMAYNFLRMDQAENVLAVCRKKRIGTALMKTTPIAIFYSLKERIEEMNEKKKDVHPLYASGLERYQEKFEKAQEFIAKHNLRNPDEIKAAAVRFALGNPDVNTVTCLAATYTELDGFLKLSGSRLNSVEKGRLDAYAEGCGDLYCRHGCGVCEPSCPHGVPVNTIMRYRQYFAAQRREKEAMGLYAGIPGSRADICASCPGYCEQACPFGVPIQGMLLEAHEMLSLP